MVIRGDDEGVLSKRLIDIPFVSRAEESSVFDSFLDGIAKERDVKSILIKGDSGTGKSFFVKHRLHDYLTKNPKIFCLYFDIANDEFQSSRLFTALINTSMLERNPESNYPVNIPKEKSFSAFSDSVIKRQEIGWKLLKSITYAFSTVTGFSEEIKEGIQIVDESSSKVGPDPLRLYLDWVSRHGPVVVAIDNYQFLNENTRNALELIITNIKHSLRYIVIDRTKDGFSQITPPFQLINRDDSHITLAKFTQDETYNLVSKVITAEENILKKISNDIFVKTAGLPKDIEFCLKSYLLKIKDGHGDVDISGLLSTIDRLPLMHQQFLLIASYLDGGISDKIARNIVRKASSIADDEIINQILDDLLHLEYLKYNTDRRDRLRAGHERIITTMQELSCSEKHSENQEELRQIIIDELDSEIKGDSFEGDKPYLMHCMLGLFSVTELQKRVRDIARLILAQYRKENFSYINQIAIDLLEVLPMVPVEAIDQILDSLQKTSEFDLGFKVIDFLEQGEVPYSDKLNLYKFKFYVQLYQYSPAEIIARNLEPSPWTTVYKTNMLLALDRYDEARNLIYETDMFIDQEANAVLMRNCIVLHSPNKALNDLNKSYRFFEAKDSDFRLATVETNMALVHLCTKSLGEAGRQLDKAITHMQAVGSKEIFQPYLNYGIRFVLGNEYQLALDYFEKSV
ncbi:hypothetical protein [Maridesulfovibrio sp.]|uniref:tetratricopeptide repeat protein n=1 Tax=Maridesulfovibrio sp. TaxID=2795000 RepID=UPI0039EF7611